MDGWVVGWWSIGTYPFHKQRHLLHNDLPNSPADMYMYIHYYGHDNVHHSGKDLTCTRRHFPHNSYLQRRRKGREDGHMKKLYWIDKRRKKNMFFVVVCFFFGVLMTIIVFSCRKIKGRFLKLWRRNGEQENWNDKILMQTEWDSSVFFGAAKEQTTLFLIGVGETGGFFLSGFWWT